MKKAGVTVECSFEDEGRRAQELLEEAFALYVEVNGLKGGEADYNGE
ncbi:MAG: hypothetical protein ACOYJD_05010 [Christensenellales bacterium]|jgi:hypothetical protein